MIDNLFLTNNYSFLPYLKSETHMKKILILILGLVISPQILGMEQKESSPNNLTLLREATPSTAIINKFKSLTTCKITHTEEVTDNTLTTIINALGRREKLYAQNKNSIKPIEVLNLSWNINLAARSIDLTPSIELLVNLQHLNLQFTNLGKIPSQIGSLKRLESLNLNNNYLQSIPSEIGQLSKLNTLLLSTNSLKTLPDALCNLTSLVLLDVTNNKLTKLPTKMGQLLNLKQLYLASNRLKKLRVLHLAGNSIKQLPIGPWHKELETDLE